MTQSKNPKEGRPAAPRRARSNGERDFRALLDAAVDAIIVIDDSGVIEEFSLAAQRVFGYAADEIIGRNVRELMPEPYQSEHDSYLARYAGTRKPHIIGIGREVVARRKDGSLFPAELAVGQVAGRGAACGSSGSSVTSRSARRRRNSCSAARRNCGSRRSWRTSATTSCTCMATSPTTFPRSSTRSSACRSMENE